MSNRSRTPAVTRFLVCTVWPAACASSARVKPTCAISWDRSADYWRVAEYRLTVWKPTPPWQSRRFFEISN